MTIDRFGERYGDPASETIGNKIDSELFDNYRNIYNLVAGAVPGTTPSQRLTYTGGKVVLANSAAPISKLLNIVVSPEMEQYAIEFGATQFNPPKTISEQYLTGTMGTAMGLKWSMAQNVTRHLVGTLGASNPTMTTAANQTGNSIATTGWAASAQVLNQGDIIRIAGVYKVNPITWRDTGQLATFVVQADVTSDVSGNATILITPDINPPSLPPSPFQTVNAAPAASAQIFVFNAAYAAQSGGVYPAGSIGAISAASSPQAMIFHKDAFTLVVVNLELPNGMDWSERVTNPKIGLSMRLLRGYDIQQNKRYTRMEVLGGTNTTRPDFAVRVPG